jgi:hypothetical protein
MKKSLVALLPVALAACVSTPPSAGTPVPDNLKPAATEGLVVTLAARGVQFYECRARKDDPQAAEWAFVAPEADLFDARGKAVGKHYAGPHWESADGSKVAGSVKARADAPRAGSIPWLLLATKSVGPAGTFARVTSIQRVNTEGGLAPAAGECKAASLGQRARIAYTADYVLFATR